MKISVNLTSPQLATLLALAQLKRDELAAEHADHGEECDMCPLLAETHGALLDALLAAPREPEDGGSPDPAGGPS